MWDIDTVVPIFSANCQEYCKFLTVVSYTREVVHNKKMIHCNFFSKTAVFSLLTIFLVLSLNFSIKSINSSSSFTEWNLTLLEKEDYISACLSSSISIPLTHSVLTKLPKNLFSPNFWRKYVFSNSVLPTTSKFPLNYPV